MSQVDLVGQGYPGDGIPEPGASTTGVRLVVPIREPTWLGRDPDGRSVLARRLSELPGAAEAAGVAAQAAGVDERVMLLRAPSLVRALGVQHVNGSWWLLSELDEGVWLDRLLELTRPTPAQAAVLGLGVLCGLRAVHAAGYAHGSFCAGEVRVGVDGQARLGGWAAGALCGPALLEQRQRADVAACGVLLADLARAARRSPACADRSAPALVAALDAAARYAALPAADVELVAASLEAGCGPDKDAAARSELAALVRAVTGYGPGAAPGPAPSAPQAVESVSSTVHREGRVARLGGRLRGLWQRIWTWVVALTVLVLVVSVEFALLHEWLVQDVQQLREAADRPGQPTVSSVEPGPVPSPAPASAGAVGDVDLRALQPCTPGAVCAIRVLVALHPQPAQRARQPAPTVVRWGFQVIDRCTGDQRSVPGGVVSAAPGSDQVQAVSTVPLPPGHALAVIAVTSEPAEAASGPLPVPVHGGACPGN